jgi:hypothetical protein
LGAAFFETPYPSNTPMENNRKGLSPVRWVVMIILPQITQRIPGGPDSLLQKVMKKAKHGISGVSSGIVLLKPG